MPGDALGTRDVALVEIEVAAVRVAGDVGWAEVRGFGVRELPLTRDSMRLRPDVLAVSGIVVVARVEHAADLARLRVRPPGAEENDDLGVVGVIVGVIRAQQQRAFHAPKIAARCISTACNLTSLLLSVRILR